MTSLRERPWRGDSGVVENLFGGYVSLSFKSVVAFAVIVLMLCVRPSGLLGSIS